MSSANKSSLAFYETSVQTLVDQVEFFEPEELGWSNIVEAINRGLQQKCPWDKIKDLPQEKVHLVKSEFVRVQEYCNASKLKELSELFDNRQKTNVTHMKRTAGEPRNCKVVSSSPSFCRFQNRTTGEYEEIFGEAAAQFHAEYLKVQKADKDDPQTRSEVIKLVRNWFTYEGKLLPVFDEVINDFDLNVYIYNECDGTGFATKLFEYSLVLHFNAHKEMVKKVRQFIGKLMPNVYIPQNHTVLDMIRDVQESGTLSVQKEVAQSLRQIGEYDENMLSLIGPARNYMDKKWRQLRFIHKALGVYSVVLTYLCGATIFKAVVRTVGEKYQLASIEADLVKQLNQLEVNQLPGAKGRGLKSSEVSVDDVRGFVESTIDKIVHKYRDDITSYEQKKAANKRNQESARLALNNSIELVRNDGNLLNKLSPRVKSALEFGGTLKKSDKKHIMKVAQSKGGNIVSSSNTSAYASDEISSQQPPASDTVLDTDGEATDTDESSQDELPVAHLDKIEPVDTGAVLLPDNACLFDTGASVMLNGDNSLWADGPTEVPKHQRMVIKHEGSLYPLTKQGTVRLGTDNGKPILISNVWEYPKVPRVILSIAQLLKLDSFLFVGLNFNWRLYNADLTSYWDVFRHDNQFFVDFSKTCSVGQDMRCRLSGLILSDSEDGTQFVTDSETLATFNSVAALTPRDYLVHLHRSTHLPYKQLLRFGKEGKTPFPSEEFTGKTISGLECSACWRSRITDSSHPTSVTPKADRIGGRVHLDLHGPVPYESREGYRYFALLVDEFSSYLWACPLRGKTSAEVYEAVWPVLKDQCSWSR